MTLRVTIDGQPASWTCDGGWRCNDALVEKTLRAACEPDTRHAHEATALAKAVRHFSGIDRVALIELGTDDDVGRMLLRMLDPRRDGAALPSDALADPPFVGQRPTPPKGMVWPGDDFERDVMRAEQSRQESARQRLQQWLDRRRSA